MHASRVFWFVRRDSRAVGGRAWPGDRCRVAGDRRVSAGREMGARLAAEIRPGVAVNAGSRGFGFLVRSTSTAGDEQGEQRENG